MGLRELTQERPPAGHGMSRRAQRQRRRARRPWRRVGWISGAFVVVVVLVVVVWAVVRRPSDGAAKETGRAVDVALGDYFIGGELAVETGSVRLEATNVGLEPHDVGIVGGRITTTLFAGQSASLDLGVLAPGTYRLFCDIGDHVARGMVATLTVTEPVPAAAP